MVNRIFSRLSWKTLGVLFWVLAVVYVGHQLLKRLDYALPSCVDFYLDDLLCLPLVLTLTLFLMRFFFGQSVRFSGYHVAFTVLYFAVAFEVIFPMFLPRYTGDPVDAVLYAVGGLIFYRFLNR